MELEAARLRLERERLALEAEQRKHDRGRVARDIAREVVSTTQAAGGAAYGVARGVGSAVLGYLGRVLFWLAMWATFVLVVSLFTFFSNPYLQDRPIYVALAYWFGAAVGPSIPYMPAPAFLTSLIRAFFSTRDVFFNAAIGIAMGLVFVVGLDGLAAEFGAAAKARPQQVAPAAAPVSRNANTGRYFSAECRLLDRSPAAVAAYDEQVRQIERDYPQLNVDSARYVRALEEQVTQVADARQREGYSACVAVRLAADSVMAGR